MTIKNHAYPFRKSSALLFALMLAISTLWPAFAADRAWRLADGPSAYMVDSQRCEMTGAVFLGDEPVSGAVITLAIGGMIVAKARTSHRGIYRVTFSARPGDLVQESALSVPAFVGSRALVRLDSSMTKPTAACKSAAITVGEIERV